MPKVKGTKNFALDTPKNYKEILVPKTICLIFKTRESILKYRVPLLSAPRLRQISENLPTDVFLKMTKLPYQWADREGAVYR